MYSIYRHIYIHWDIDIEPCLYLVFPNGLLESTPEASPKAAFPKGFYRSSSSALESRSAPRRRDTHHDERRDNFMMNVMMTAWWKAFSSTFIYIYMYIYIYIHLYVYINTYINTTFCLLRYICFGLALSGGASAEYNISKWVISRTGYFQQAPLPNFTVSKSNIDSWQN